MTVNMAMKMVTRTRIRPLFLDVQKPLICSRSLLLASQSQFRPRIPLSSLEARHRARQSRRWYSVPAPDYLDESERAIFEQLNAELAPSELEVQDISHGCGSMYAIAITSEKFKGLSTVRQHRVVNELLKDRIKSWHGMQLRTKAP